MQSQNEFTINKKYTRLTIQKFAYALLIIGAINWLFIGFFDLNLLTGIFGLNLFSRALFVLVGLAGIYFMFQRDFYLPFLGESVLPCSGLEDREPSGADTSVTVQVEPTIVTFVTCNLALFSGSVMISHFLTGKTYWSAVLYGAVTFCSK